MTGVAIPMPTTRAKSPMVRTILWKLRHIQVLPFRCPGSPRFLPGNIPYRNEENDRNHIRLSGSQVQKNLDEQRVFRNSGKVPRGESPDTFTRIRRADVR